MTPPRLDPLLEHSFLSPLTNLRDDEWGGSLENRLRFPRRLVRAVREAVGPDYVVGMRMVIDEDRPGGLGPDEGIEAARRLAADGIDLFSVLVGSIDTNHGLTGMIPSMGQPSAPYLDLAARVKREVGVPVLHAARITDVATARHAIREGLLDLVGMTRTQLADPHLVRKIAAGEEHRIRPCVGASYCLDAIYEDGAAKCIHNAATGREQYTWDVMGGAVRLSGDVLVYDEHGGHQALDAAEHAAGTGARVELVTPERTVGPDVGAMNIDPYLAAFARRSVTLTPNYYLRSVRREAERLVVTLWNEYADLEVERTVDHVVAEHGTTPVDDLYFGLVADSVNQGEVDHGALVGVRPQAVRPNPEGRYQLFRVGDAVASRSIHASIYDAARLCQPL